MGEDMIHNIICLVIGYFCGCISSGYFVGKFHHIDIREHGSGNAGTTNVLRVLGKLPALITFVGDLAKAVMPILVIRIFLSPDNWYLLCLYMGLGVVLGHNYPFYLGFKGGKGIAVTAVGCTPAFYSNRNFDICIDSCVYEICITWFTCCCVVYTGKYLDNASK